MTSDIYMLKTRESDSQVVYSLFPNPSFTNTYYKSYQASDLKDWNNLSDIQRQCISIILQFSYPITTYKTAGTSSANAAYVGTQILIWEYSTGFRKALPSDEPKINSNNTGSLYKCIKNKDAQNSYSTLLTHLENAAHASYTDADMIGNSEHLFYMKSATTAYESPLMYSIPEVRGIVGDSDNSGVINIKDSSAIQKNVAKTSTPHSYLCKELCDVNNDGKITIKDASLIQKYLAKSSSNIGYCGRTYVWSWDNNVKSGII